MAQDNKGNELKVGDEIIVRAKIQEIHPLAGDYLLKVEWERPVGALLDFVKASTVEKKDDIDRAS